MVFERALVLGRRESWLVWLARLELLATERIEGALDADSDIVGNDGDDD